MQNQYYNSFGEYGETPQQAAKRKKQEQVIKSEKPKMSGWLLALSIAGVGVGVATFIYLLHHDNKVMLSFDEVSSMLRG